MSLKIFIIIFLSCNYCFGQSSNTLSFKTLARGSNQPIMAASLVVYDSINMRSYRNFSDSTGIIQFDLSWLKGDSAFVSLRVATDTLTTFTIYKHKTYSLQMVYYVDTEAIKKKNEIFRKHKRRKSKSIVKQ
jgi:hypothetical protein